MPEKSFIGVYVTWLLCPFLPQNAERVCVKLIVADPYQL